ncbi:MAG: deoxyribonuclease V [Acidobacteriota bacterium]|jgi:deoxyribonuclease V
MRRPNYRNPRYAGAVRRQEEMAAQVRLSPLPADIRFVAGADVSFFLYGSTFWGGMVVCDLEDGLRPVESAVVRMEVTFPYIPGLLGFREVPVLTAAFERLKIRPDVLLVDAHGIAHPRYLGSASHLGVALGTPSVGCAKSRLCGEHEEPGNNRGRWSPLVVEGETRGAVLRTRSSVKPVFVSPGHLCNLRSAVELVLKCAPRYRIPEPIRRAHDLTNSARRSSVASG